MTKNHHFNNVIIAAGPVVIRDGKVLVNKHGESNSWKFPGGDISEAAGDLSDWAAKKANEELGVKVKILRPLSPMVLTKDNEVIVLIHYLAELTGEEIKPADYVREYKWLDINDLPEDCSPNVRSIIDEYKKL